MANYITNRISFEKEHKEIVLKSCVINGNFDFNTLIPQPLQMYHGDLALGDEQEFKCNWYSWNIENWGTKSNACDTVIEETTETITIQFETPWGRPVPVIVAFGNKFKFPFMFEYKDESDREWTKQRWVPMERGWIKRYND